MLLIFIIALILVPLLKCENFLPKTQYRLGGIFSDIIHQATFQVAINQINEINWNTSFFELIPENFNVSYYNSLEARKAACSLLENGIVGIVGPNSIHTSNYIQLICDTKGIPQIETHHYLKIERSHLVVNLHPHPNEIAQFFVHLVKTFKWNRVIVLFEDEKSLIKLTSILDLNIEYEVDLMFRQLDKDSTGSYREVLSNIKRMPEFNILLECSMEILEEVLKQAQQVGIMTEDYNYIITNLDMSSIELEPYKYGGTNITGIRLFDPEDKEIKTLSKKIFELIPNSEKLSNYKMRLSDALLIDGISMLNEVLKDFSSSSIIEEKSLTCDNTEFWKYGYTIANQLKGKQIVGLTKKIQFDNEGLRRDFKLDIIELTTAGLIKIGQWDSRKKMLSIQRKAKISGLEQVEVENNLFNTTFKIAIVLTAPYAMLKETTEQLVGNDRFEGFCIDVIEELRTDLQFNYTFIVQKDGKNGNFNRSTNQWDGVIRQIIDGKADLAITDLTITSERENAVDFSMPFMNLGISILYKAAEPVPPSLFMFLSPFSTSVWLMLGVAYMLVSIAIFIMGRLSPSEWNNPYPCIEEPEYLVNQFSIRNSLWYTIGGLLQQGSELAPISISTRTASGFWWFFVLIMVASYTANLAAFLTVETLVTPFKNIEDLAKQSEIKYGAKKQGATENFFRDSNISIYRKVSKYMIDHPKQMTNDNEEGFKRVENENYAYLMESTTIEYIIQRHCSLSQIGGLLDDKGYGIAMKKESPYRNELSMAIIKLQESGVLTRLKIKWWKEKRGGSTCSVKSGESEAEPLNLKNVGGVFLVLFVGTILAFFGSVIEKIVATYRKCKGKKKQLFINELKKELIFFVKFKKNIREVIVEKENADY